MPTLTYFFRSPHRIYFSIEKLFHAVSVELKNQSDAGFNVRELNLPFTSKLQTIRKNISFVKENQSRLNHITGDVQYAILGFSRKNINILTIHDCVLLYHYPKSNPRHWIIKYLWYWLPVKRADAVTVISEQTKKDVLHFTGCSPEKIRVIPNFIDPGFRKMPKSFNETRPDLLFIGTAPNKNLERTLEAIQGLSVQLTIVGYLNETQEKDLKTKNIQYRLINNLSDQEMREVYAASDVMIFPSLHEGFGLPILEAQATGRPILTSQLEPMASVSGGAACLVDPTNSESIRSGLLRLIGDKSFRDNLVVRGFENVNRFQLKNVASQYCALYIELLKKKAN